MVSSSQSELARVSNLLHLHGGLEVYLLLIYIVKIDCGCLLPNSSLGGGWATGDRLRGPLVVAPPVGPLGADFRPDAASSCVNLHYIGIVLVPDHNRYE